MRIANVITKRAFKGLVMHVAKDGDIIERKLIITVCRKKLAEEEETLAVFWTWRKESLFQYLGKEFLEAMGSMTDKGYKFVLSIHPRVCQIRRGCRAMGHVLEYAKNMDLLLGIQRTAIFPILLHGYSYIHYIPL